MNCHDVEIDETPLVATPERRERRRGERRRSVGLGKELGWEVWRSGQLVAAFAFWDDADKWRRLNLPETGEIKPSAASPLLHSTA
jgi:hypothetical protein